ncbi:MAG: hypothetical protein SFX72_09565 [Isosphaeraceae bacterium]|nr:hypothetical protein [Isosphaeraceae bacterium]
MDQAQSPTPRGGRAYLSPDDFDDLIHAVDRDRWGVGLRIVAWIHLATFLGCEALFSAGERRPPFYLGLWALELFAVVATVRRTVTARGRRTPPRLTGLVVRVWVTFLILQLSAVSLNSLMGLESMDREWFKPMWATLATFGFAMTAWLTNPWFLVPAVQMSLTALTIVRFPAHAYLIYGLSWFVALHLVAFGLERGRKRRIAGSTSTPSAEAGDPTNVRLVTNSGRAARGALSLPRG